MTTYLGIDYGTAHIGLALAEGPLARPVASLEGPSNTVAQEIARLAEENGVEGIVIGLPEGKMDAEVRVFGSKIESLSGKNVIYHPETLSTHDALVALRASGASRTKRQNDHVYAACLILEDYLESIREA